MNLRFGWQVFKGEETVGPVPLAYKGLLCIGSRLSPYFAARLFPRLRFASLSNARDPGAIVGATSAESTSCFLERGTRWSAAKGSVAEGEVGKMWWKVQQ